MGKEPFINFELNKEWWIRLGFLKVGLSFISERFISEKTLKYCLVPSQKKNKIRIESYSELRKSSKVILSAFQQKI